MAKKTILIVEDEGIIAEDIKRSLEGLGYAVLAVVASGEEALKKVEENKPDLVLMDIVLRGEMDGVEAADQIRSRSNIPVVYLTAYADVKTIERAKVTEPFGYIIKPFENRELHTTVEMALHKHKLETSLKESKEWFATTLRSIGDAVIATDKESVVTFINPIAQSLTGWKEEDAVGKPLEEVFNIINELTRASAENPVTKVIREGIIVGLANHTVLIAKDGKETPIDDSAAPIKDEKGNIIGVVLVFRDVTERRRAQRAIQEAREYAEGIIETVREPLVVLGPDLRVISANRSFYKNFETTPEKAEGILFYELDHRQWDIPKLRELLGEIIPQNTSFDNFEVEHKFPKLGRRMLVLNARRIYRETNSTKMILLAIEDVTERKRAEEALKESKEKYRTLIESSSDCICHIDLEGNFIYMNQGGIKLNELERDDELLGQACTTGVKEEYINKMNDALDKAKKGKTTDVVYESTNVKGRDLWWESIVGPIKDAKGNVVSIVRISRNVTKRKIAEEALQESEEKFKNAFDHAIVGRALVEPRGNFIKANQSMCKISGYTEEELLRKTWMDLTLPEDTETSFDNVKKLVEGKIPSFRLVERLVRKDRSYRWIDLNVVLVKDLHGKPLYMIADVVDITEQKQAEEKLKKYSEELERSNRLKDLFTDILRHDLLNPLGIIQNATEILMELDLPPEDKNELTVVERNIMKLKSMIDDATKYSKLETIDKLDFEKADLNEIVRKAIKRVEPYATIKEIRVVNKLDGEHYSLLNPFIEDVFTNILSNALKYTPEKSKVIVELEDNNKDWRISIKDFGEGIPDEHKEDIFHRFERVKKRGVKGTGLGLAIAKRIVKLHNGKIWVEDNPEGGCIFYVNLSKAII